MTEKTKQQKKIEKSKDAVKRLNDFSYLKERREKNRERNEELRRREEPAKLPNVARPGSPDPQP